MNGPRERQRDIVPANLPRTTETLPAPPDNLSFGAVTLRFVHVVPGNAARGFVPFYHFRIRLADGSDVGHINFRVGNTEHVRLCAGHIGYEIAPAFRGRGYALEACRALAPFARSFYSAVIITADPDNHASIRTIEGLKATFLGELPVPINDPNYARGARSKLHYQWTL